MQVSSVVITGFSLTQTSRVVLPGLAWYAPCGVAVLASLVAPVLYLVASRWWSSFCGLVPTAVQAFLVLQLALYGV